MRYHSLTALALLALSQSSLALPDGVGGHHAHHAEHAAAAAAPPAAGYQEPVASYEAAADPGYAVPDAGYGTPDYDTGYYGTGQGYDVAPQEGYEVAEAENGMSMIIVPLLIAAALFLLFPSTRTVAVNSRKRREADDSPAANMVERVQDMYMALMESEECMERIACEVGGLVADAGISKSMTKMAGQFVPKKYSKMMKTFNHGKDCKKNNKCGLF